MRRASLPLAVAVTVAFAASCGTSSSGPDDATAGTRPITGTILVFAAASLTDAFADIEQAFETEYPGTDVQLNLAGSSGLREQILEGAPVDVFASANEANMTRVAEAEGTAGPAQVFARNRLQIAVPAGNPAGVRDLADFERDELLIGLCAEEVPCGQFAREALDAAGIDASLDTNEPDVRALLTKLGAGELDAGIVYVTDVSSGDGLVEGIDIPAAVNIEADYPIAPLASAPNPGGATAFVAFVLSPDGQGILRRYGFDVG